MNVVLLDDDVSPWSINFVKSAVLRAVEHDSEINFIDGMILRHHIAKDWTHLH